MKRFIIVLIACICISSNLKAQQEVPVDSMQFIYCQLVGTQKLLSNKMTVSLDFGQLNKFGSDQRLRDKNGEVIVFNSMVDAMNWMGAQGWEFVQAYVAPVGNQNVYHWLLKKSTKKMSTEEKNKIFEMFKTKKDFKKQKTEE